MIRAYGFLLKFYPREHQAAFGAEMGAVFEQAAQEQRGRGWVAYLRFLWAEAAGLIAGLSVQWISALTRRNRTPELAASTGEASAGLPHEIVCTQLRIRRILDRMEYAIAHHQFDRARFYSIADQKEREHLCRLWRNYGLEGEPRTLSKMPE